jgi:RNA polymerase sigma-70 factor (ECF subfamily)
MDPQMSVPSAEVLLEHADFLRRLAHSLLHDPQAAEDVAQDALVAALGRPPRPENLRAWLAKVARHLALSRARSERRRERRERAAARPEGLPSAAEGVARLELQRRVVEAVLALDEPYRSIVVHRFFYGLTQKEIAGRLGVPLQTVRTRQRRAFERLRARLDAAYGGDRRSLSIALLALAAVPRRGVAATLGGMLAMSAKTKIAVVMLLVACAAMLIARLGGGSLRAPHASDRAGIASSTQEEGAAETVPALPATVDFAAIDRDRDVHGVVVDDAGNPVPGARMTMVRYPAMGILRKSMGQLREEEGPQGRTAADGTFALRAQRGEEVDLRVEADGFVPLQRRWCPAGGKLRIELRRGVRVLVRALDPSGEPLAGVRIVAFKDGRSPAMESAGLYVFLEGTTNAEGLCTLADLLPQRTLMVCGWHAEFDFPEPMPVQLPEQGDTEAEVRAARGRTISGWITDAETGRPVPDAAVSDYPVPIRITKAVRTDEEGRYTYGGWNTESHLSGHLYVHASGYATSRQEVGERERIDFALRRGYTVKGVVHAADGTSVVDAHVGAMGRGPERDGDFRETWSDPAGCFELRGLRRDLPHTLTVTKARFGRLHRPFAHPPKGRAIVELGVVTLPSGHRLEGRVLGTMGEPLEGMCVKLRREMEGLDHGNRYERHVDDLGRFRFRDLANGRYALSVALADRRRLERAVTIDGEDVLDVHLRFEAGHKLTVRVTDAAGQPVFRVLLGAARSLTKTTDTEGRAFFELPPKTDSTHVTVVRLPDDRFVRPLRPADWALGQGELRIVLREAAPVSGRVLLSGKPLAWAIIALNGPEGFRGSAYTDEKGEFSAAVPAGSHVDLALTGQVRNESLPVYGELEQVAAGTTGVVLSARRVPLDRSLHVRVVTPEGAGVSGMQIRISARGWRGDPGPPWKTDADGRIEFSGLPAGKTSVHLIADPPPPWARPKQRLHEVVPDGQEIVIMLREANPIRGVVTRPGGTVAAGMVTAWRGQEWVARAVVASDGSFVLYVPADEPEPVRLEAVGHGEGGVLRGGVDGVLPGADGVTVPLRQR